MLRTILVLLFVAPLSLMAEESLSPIGFTLCKNSKIVRTIRVEKDPSAEQFVTYYTKSGKDREVGRAKWRPSAEKFQTNIKTNLEAAGWKCENIKDYKVTSIRDS